jgi:hypothetical protein
MRVKTNLFSFFFLFIKTKLFLELNPIINIPKLKLTFHRMETTIRNRKNNKKIKEPETIVKSDEDSALDNDDTTEKDLLQKNERLQQIDDELLLKKKISKTQKDNDNDAKSSNNNLELSLIDLLNSGTVSVTFDLIPVLLFVLAFSTRIYKLWIPNNIV